MAVTVGLGQRQRPVEWGRQLRPGGTGQRYRGQRLTHDAVHAEESLAMLVQASAELPPGGMDGDRAGLLREAIDLPARSQRGK
jgi:hypothetical protein